MLHRYLGRSGLQVPALCYGTATFGGGNEFFKAWGSTQGKEAQRLIDICLEAGLNFFDTANVYSQGLSEEILGDTLKGKSNVIVSTKATFPMGEGPQDFGSSRSHLVKSCEESLKRLKRDHIDIYHLHGQDLHTPLEETLRALDDLVTAGKVRYIACSNFSGWHLMKSLSLSEKNSWSKFVAHQVYYSLVGREYEWELMPLGLDQGIGALIWSPLAAGALTGKIRRNQKAPPESRLGKIDFIPYDSEKLYQIVDVLEQISEECGKSITQVSLNWLLQRPTVTSLIIGAKNEEQLKHNLGALGWNLTVDQVKRLDEASKTTPIYPYWHQKGFPQLVPSPV